MGILGPQTSPDKTPALEQPLPTPTVAQTSAFPPSAPGFSGLITQMLTKIASLMLTRQTHSYTQHLKACLPIQVGSRETGQNLSHNMQGSFSLPDDFKLHRTFKRGQTTFLNFWFPSIFQVFFFFKHRAQRI